MSAVGKERGGERDAGSGKPRSEEELPPELRKEAKPEEKSEVISRTIEKINAGRQAGAERVKASQTETESPENMVYISADDVGVRHQKEHRVGENQKKGAFVWSANALVQSREGVRIFTCVGMKKAFPFALAYLLDKETLKNRSLAFSLTGQAIFCRTSRKCSCFIRIASF